MNQLMNDKAVYRTAPATPGLLKIWRGSIIAWLVGCRRCCCHADNSSDFTLAFEDID